MSKAKSAGQRAGKEPAKRSGATKQTEQAKLARKRHAQRNADKQMERREARRAKRNPVHDKPQQEQ